MRSPLAEYARIEHAFTVVLADFDRLIGSTQFARALVLGLLLALPMACTDGAAPTTADASARPVDASDDATASALPTDFDRELRLATLQDRDPAPDIVDVELEARVARVELAPGRYVEAFTYNGVMPGPTLRAKEGDLVRVHFKNSLAEATTIHWHGLEVPADQDGAGHEGGAIAAGATFEFAFRVPHAGTYWYHPHVNSAEQVWRGLYGALIVDGAREPALGAEQTLVLSDLSYRGETIAPAAEHGDLGRYFGHEGSTLLVNGRELPTLRAYAGSTLRLRIINAAISRYFRFAVDGHSLVRVAGDSGFSERSQIVEHQVLTPGERAELVLTVRGAPGSVIPVRALAQDRFDCGGNCGETLDLLRIEVVDGVGRSLSVSTDLTQIPAIDISNAVAREIELHDSTRDGKTHLAINGHVYGSDTLELKAEVGATELWHIVNPTQYHHPFHLHGFRFQVLDVRGRAPLVREWKDTVDVAAKSDLRIAVHYDDRPGMWMFHCHILDHAELGMMGVLHLAPHAH